MSFDVEVMAGKPLDVLALKGIDLAEVREYAAFLASTAQRLYRGGPLQAQRACPMCGASLADAHPALAVFGVEYRRCAGCGHVGVGARPDPQVLDQVFAESETHSSVYVDRAALEVRMRQIIAPKLDWCARQFSASRARAPASALDVGAGGGHFLAGAARRGWRIEGFEKSRASCAFAREAFALELRQDDFLDATCAPADLVTFWGLLEYVERPREFIAAARRALTPDGLLVVEVPRVDALGTAVQAMEGAVVARHMDPTTHVNGFTDESLCTALVEEGFAPVAAWYFGMDAYEACVQMALRLGTPEVFPRLAEFIPAFQAALDRGRQCDDIIIAAVPLEGR
jgi:2-polyprenyl-3-methyl-5-hydroxy-6-metoxy-1,4-benzoquinol methylase